MKLHTERGEIERSGVQTETPFQIKTCSTSFQILSSGLYTDGIQAIIRELSCNAYDAHVAAGKSDVPFEIHLPNDNEPWFHVKDFGTGLSDVDVQGEIVPVQYENAQGEIVPELNSDGTPKMVYSGGLYTTYFDSNKTDSNDYIGALGLGSKSPFSYADSFEVTSIHNKKCRTYAVFINEHGVPTVALMREIDSIETNGMEIRVAVQTKDFRKFETKTAQVLKWFPVQPNVIGVINFEFDPLLPPHKHISGPTWRIHPRAYKDPKMIAVQGNVAYKVDLSHLDVNKSIEQILTRGLVIGFFDIGELEIAASREEIKYDNRSKKALIAKIQTVEREMLTSIEKQLEQYTGHLWDATIYLNSISEEILKDSVALSKFMRETKEPTTHPLLKHFNNFGGQIRFPFCRSHTLVKYKYRYRTLSRTVDGEVYPHDKMMVVINDIKTGGVALIRQFLMSSKTTTILMIQPNKKSEYTKTNDDGTNTTIPITQEDRAKELQQILNRIGNPPAKRLSVDFPKFKRRKLDLPIYKIDMPKHRFNSPSWDKVELDDDDLKQGGLYLHLKGKREIMIKNTIGVFVYANLAIRELQHHLPEFLAMIKEKFPALPEFKKNIIGVGARALPKFTSQSNWYNIVDLVHSLVPHYQQEVEFEYRIRNTPNVIGLVDERNNDETLKQIKQLERHSKFRMLVQPMFNDHKKLMQHEMAIPMLMRLNRSFTGIKEQPEIPPYFTIDDLYDTYPMLTYVSRIRAISYTLPLFKYISFMDNHYNLPPKEK